MAQVYVARKSCGCIVAAFPLQMDKAVKGEILKQISKAGWDVEQASDRDVRLDFHISCDHNKPPLLAYMDSRTSEGAFNRAEVVKDGAMPPEEPAEVITPDGGGVDQADVDALANDDETQTGDPEIDDPFDDARISEEHVEEF